MVLFDILKYSFSSLIWGAIISVACMALFLFLIKGCYKDATFSPVSYLVGAMLFLFISFQCILIVGSLKIISMTDEYEQQITALVQTYSSSDEVSLTQASEIIDAIIDKFPILEYYISGGEFSGYTASQLPAAIAQELRSFMRWYIFRRILWCLGFVAVGAFLVIRSLTKNYTNPRRERIQHDRKRVSRRPRR